MNEPAVLYRSPLALPEARSGRFAVKHKTFAPGIPVCLVSAREAFMTGRRVVNVMLDAPLLVHELVEHDEDGGVERVWMSDEPEELRQFGEWMEAAPPTGRVLVGGLGLGIAASVIATRAGGTRVDVVELSEDVVRLVARPGEGATVPVPRYRVIVGDIRSFLSSIGSWPYDCAYLDTWQGTNESTWWSEVMPLRRVIANRFGRQRVHCWAEKIMLGQVSRAIEYGNRSNQLKMMELMKHRGEPPGRSWRYKRLPREMSRLDVTRFLRDVGLPAWERRWGRAVDDWDEKENGA